MKPPYEPPKNPHRLTDPFVLPEKVDTFRLLRPLGRGGMGQVYLAHDETLERQVALKFIASIRPGREQRERFLIEARAIARIHHPNVVSIYSVGEHNGTPYLVSEYVEGHSLAQIEKPIPSPSVLRIAIDLARGLDAAHQRGVLHRDVKPGNILLSKTGVVKLLDFGLAKLLQDSFIELLPTDKLDSCTAPLRRSRASEDLEQTISLIDSVSEQRAAQSDSEALHLPTITQPGTRLGTPLYMAPELWRGEQGTVRADLYSLGAVLYELACGRPPHQAACAAQLESLVVHEEAAPLLTRASSLDPQLAEIIDSCLRRDPQQRPSSAQELSVQLESLRMPDEAAAIPEGNPYRGLRPFEPTDRPLLFGRRQDIAAVIDQLRVQPFVLITGDSGVGKSSLCRAGVLPAIRDGALNEDRSWLILTMIPGRWPLHAMVDALTPILRTSHGELLTSITSSPAKLTMELNRKLGTHYGLLLFIDQLEELVTQSSQIDARALGEFLSHLTQRLPGVRILAAIRGDFLTRVAEQTQLSYELSHAVYLLRPLSPPDLREVIEGPARIKGVRFEDEAMIESMVRSTERAEGGLPLLQFALAQLWERRDVSRGLILSSTLEAMGGVEGALSSYTQSVLKRMLPEQVAAARRMLVHLVRSDGTRICRSEKELGSGDPAEPIALDMLVQSRLLVAKRQSASVNSYELAHDSLPVVWPQLREWLSQDREQQTMLERVESAANEWLRFHQSADLLWKEIQLQEFERLCSQRQLAPPAQAFVSETKRNLRRQKRQKVVLAVCAIALALFVLSFYARASQQANAAKIREEERAKRQKEIETDRAALRLNFEENEVTQMVHQAGRELEALKKVRELVKKYRTKDGIPAAIERALVSVMMAPGRVLPAMKHEGEVLWVEYSPDGSRLVSASQDGTARLWDAKTGGLVRTLSCHTGPVAMARFSKDGQQVVTVGADGKACVYDTKKEGQPVEATLHGGPIHAVAFSPDGRRILTAGADQAAVLWDIGSDSGHKLILSSDWGSVRAAVFSPDGKTVATGGEDAVLRLWSARDGKLVRKLAAHDHGILVLNYSPDGRYLVSGGADHMAKVWTAHDGVLKAQLVDHRSPVMVASFSPDSQRVLTAANYDVAARLWDAATGVRLMTLNGHSAQLHWATFSPDGTRIATMGFDHMVRLWHGQTGAPLVSYRGHQSEVLHAVFAPHSHELATAGKDHIVQVWREQLGAIINLPSHTKSVWSGTFTPDGQIAVTAGGDGKVMLSSPQDGKKIAELTTYDEALTSVAVSPNGQWLAASGFGERHNAFLWNMASKQRIDLLGHSDRVQTIAFSPDGHRLLTVSHDKTAKVWDVSTGKVFVSLPAGTTLWYGTFSPDGRQVVTVGDDGLGRIWDSQTGQLLIQLAGHTSLSCAVLYSQDGQWIATGSSDKTARIWNAQTGDLTHTLRTRNLGEGHTDWVTSLSFSKDGKTLLTASHDGTVIGWDVTTGKFKFSLVGHQEGIWSVQYSPDGKRIVTASADHTARVWSAESNELLGVLKGHLGAVHFAGFSPDGKSILTVSVDKTARIYN
jgi:WD40 repeat protein/serine/threonine protein kinase